MDGRTDTRLVRSEDESADVLDLEMTELPIRRAATGPSQKSNVVA